MGKSDFIFISIIVFFAGVFSGMAFNDNQWFELLTGDTFFCSALDSADNCNAKQDFQAALHDLKQLN